MKSRLSLFLLVGALTALEARLACAEQVRFRFVPTDAGGNMTQVAAGPNGAVGERLTGLGLRPQPFERSFRANQLVTFRHPYSGRNVTLPLTLPLDSTPRLEHRRDGVVFNYGMYAVEVRFFADGSAEVVYNSGFLRPLAVQ
jgi:hypothetical protein